MCSTVHTAYCNCNLQIICSALTSKFAALFPDPSWNVDTRTGNFCNSIISAAWTFPDFYLLCSFSKADLSQDNAQGCIAKILYYTKYLSFLLNHCFTSQNLSPWNMTTRLPPLHLLFSPSQFLCLQFYWRSKLLLCRYNLSLSNSLCVICQLYDKKLLLKSFKISLFLSRLSYETYYRQPNHWYFLINN